MKLFTEYLLEQETYLRKIQAQATPPTPEVEDRHAVLNLCTGHVEIKHLNLSLFEGPDVWIEKTNE